MSIAEKLTIIANNTTDVFVSGYNAGYAEGEEWGFSEGWADNEGMVASALNSPVQKVESYSGFDCGAVDSMGQIQYLDENIPKVYEKGVYDGVADGRQAEYDEFWDAFQQNGNRTDYHYGFAGRGWRDETFKPKYDIVVRGGDSMFAWFNYITTDTPAFDMKGYLEERRLKLDFSQNTASAYRPFFYANISRLGVLNVSKTLSLAGFFSNAKISSVDSFITSEAQDMTTTFDGCTNLKDISFDGIVGQNLNMKSCPLSKASIESVVNSLSGTVSGMTVTFKESAVTDAFGSTTAQEWLDLTATKSNWTISLV